MPGCNSCPLDAALAKTKSRKSSKGDKCCPPSPCDVECCKPECELDCCTIPYQRLDKLRTAWSEIAATGGTFLPQQALGVVTGVYTRGGSTVPNAPNGAGPGQSLAFYAYTFVQTHRYLNFEACGKLDQVVGWIVDTSDGDLVLLQNLPDLNLTTAISRATLIGEPTTSLSSVEKAQLYALNIFYKASLKAIEAVGGNPKEEGNIVTVTDKCGQKWLLAINRRQYPDATNGVCDNNTQYVIVGIPLC